MFTTMGRNVILTALLLLVLGGGVRAQDPDLTRNALAGDANAQFSLAKYYFTQKDGGNAIVWLERAAQGGNVSAQEDLGGVYQSAFWVRPDIPKSVYWHTKAAEAGNHVAEINLYLLYMNGDGIPKDYPQSLHWLQRAAQEDYSDGQLCLARAYRDGQLGLPKDSEKAKYWYGKAAAQAKQGDTTAKDELAAIESETSPPSLPVPSANSQANAGDTNGTTVTQSQDLPPSTAGALPEPIASNQPSDSAANQDAQAAREQSEQEESDRQQKIQELQGEIESEQKNAEMYEGNAADLQRQQAATAGQPGGAAGSAILQIGIDKFNQDAETARQRVSELTSQIEEVQGESTAASREQASAAASNGPTANPDSTGDTSASQQGASSGGSGTYTGPNANWVHQLLGRVGSWSCPSSPIAQDGVPPQVQTSGTSMRDQYVKSAVLQAWGAECYARQQRDNEAQAQALAMMTSLQDVQNLCGSGAVFSNGPTDGVYRCGELQGGSAGNPAAASTTHYVYYQTGMLVTNVGPPQFEIIFLTAPQGYPYLGTTIDSPPQQVADQATAAVEAYVRRNNLHDGENGGPLVSAGDLQVQSATENAMGSKQVAENLVQTAMNNVYTRYLGFHSSDATVRIVLIDPVSGNVLRELQVNALPKPPSGPGAHSAR